MTVEVGFEDVLAAEPIVHRCLPRTPLYEYPGLSRQLGCQFWVKHENHLPTGAFKVRGGVNLIESMNELERRRGVIAVSTGNHGQSLAWACRRAGAACTIVVPKIGNPDKKTAMRDLNANVIEYGRDFDEAKEFCERLARNDSTCGPGPWIGEPPRYVHSANEPKLIAGVGTYALEIFDSIPAPDALLVPIGLGSGISGASIVARHLSPKTRIIGVQAEGAPAVAKSWQSGVAVRFDRIQTSAEGLATREPAELTLRIMRQLVDEIVLVSDDEIHAAIRLLLAGTHNLVEGAGAATTAAVAKIGDQLHDATVVAVVSGANLDLATLPSILAPSEAAN